ncbi:hypothetical protein B0H17DRAFT_1236313 [Mycena rosella]|uniref:Uncharacterized protein n=1 Tax=Mycena rosella TaxID=1033263 RepID=A0AAD7D5C7_MYCRO|nr:hypothetical protein B0H17DRAFT_1236313 [Mycena rosella]
MGRERDQAHLPLLRHHIHTRPLSLIGRRRRSKPIAALTARSPINRTPPVTHQCSRSTRPSRRAHHIKAPSPYHAASRYAVNRRHAVIVRQQVHARPPTATTGAILPHTMSRTEHPAHNDRARPTAPYIGHRSILPRSWPNFGPASRGLNDSPFVLVRDLRRATVIASRPSSFHPVGPTWVLRVSPLPLNELLLALRAQLDFQRVSLDGISSALKAEPSRPSMALHASFVLPNDRRYALQSQVWMRLTVLDLTLNCITPAQSTFGPRTTPSHPDETVFERDIRRTERSS